MKALVVYAHPEPRSFNGALKDAAVRALAAGGHEVVVSDLYAMHFKCVIDQDDFSAPANPDFLQIPLEQEAAHASATTAPDVAAEQGKLLWADLVLFQFPLWLYGQPAIMKGWCERVFSSGFAHEVKADPASRRWFERGALAGKRALLSVTCAGAESAYAPDGRHGDIHRILWPVHNALRYSGFDVLAPFVSYAVLRAGEDWRRARLADFEERLRSIERERPLPFHRLDEYGDDHRLKPGISPRTAGQHRPGGG